MGKESVFIHSKIIVLVIVHTFT